jgi:hypothetical protein
MLSRRLVVHAIAAPITAAADQSATRIGAEVD